MLDNLRAMGVFACVVERGSFSGAAKELCITTSAVSQQIRSLELEMNATLLHRSTRKISLTEAGHAFFQSCQEMMAAAERGKIRISELQDHLIGELKIATTPELATMHLIPALNHWMTAHASLSVKIEAAHRFVDLITEHVDIAIRMSAHIEQHENYEIIPLASVDQVLLVSSNYMNHHPAIESPSDLLEHHLLPIELMKDYSKLHFTHISTGETLDIEMKSKVKTDSIAVMKCLCQHGLGVARILYLDAQKELNQAELIEILPNWKLPQYQLYAMILKREQQPMKIVRCLENLKSYFSKLPGGR